MMGLGDNPAPAVRVLLVDDEVRVLEGLSRQLALDFDVHAAQSGFEALRMLRDEGPFDVVVSDMRMPRMTGAVLFGRVRELWPDVTRILLTGYSDTADAAEAINRGAIFRYLNKPCDGEALAEAISAGAVRAAELRAERALLEQTLHGLVGMIGELVSFVHPESFEGVARVRSLAREFARALELTDAWQLELAAALYPLGRIFEAASARGELHGEGLDEARAFRRSMELVGPIPRLDGVGRILGALATEQGLPSDGVESLSTEILRACVRLELYERAHGDLGMAADALSADLSPRLAEALARVVVGRPGYARAMVEARALSSEMVLDQDVRSPGGTVLATRGQRLTELMCRRIADFHAARQLPGPIAVLLPATEACDAQR